MNFENKTVVVTGASRGIGKSIALKFADKGANIVVNFAASPDKAQELVKEIEAKGVKAIAVKADVSKPQEVEELFDKAMEVFGTVDVLVNNAGITKDNLMIKMKEEDFDNVININLKGAFNCTKSAAKIMMKQRTGKIINISSVIGIMGNIGQTNYAASKAGIIGLTKASAKELALRGINVNAIAPGFIKSDMTEVLDEKIKENILKQIPLGVLGETEDVANAALFLASEEARYITGHILTVDGGMVMY